MTSQEDESNIYLGASCALALDVVVVVVVVGVSRTPRVKASEARAGDSD